MLAFGQPVVSYSISTSNHNFSPTKSVNALLYLIPFLHQTTTPPPLCTSPCALYLIPFLHQTTTTTANGYPKNRCILFHFYIKPQLVGYLPPHRQVVSYSISTSNHNSVDYLVQVTLVVSYSISTSNHNLWRIRRYFQAHYRLNHILIFNGML